MSRSTDYLTAADRTLEETYEQPMSLAAFVDRLFEEPRLARHASRYVLDAIEAAGTRTVVEGGEEKERYRFFDDPANDGEHAVLGNTGVLSSFVDDLRAIAAGRGKAETILWIEGPTATGKSELKRCLINGLRAYSKTPEGRRHTLEWNVQTVRTEERGLSYGTDPTVDDDEHWYDSPVQTHPLSVFPAEVRDGILEGVATEHPEAGTFDVDVRLDPFSREAYDYLERRYRREGRTDLFSAITDERHLRVKNYVVDEGRGIGVLHPEDGGSPKERLVGSWMGGMLQELDSRGRKHPQAFSYDGALSQGNGALTIIEDATQHADLLGKLLSVPDEGTVKLDAAIGMDLDTQLLLISNPDLEDVLDQHEDRANSDPLKALKRRLTKRTFRYLTNRSLEVQLLRRELTDETAVWTETDPAVVDDLVADPVRISVRAGDESTTERELAPHSLEAAALYSVVTRLSAEHCPNDFDLVDLALLLDRGYVDDPDGHRTIDDVDLATDTPDGTHGIPVTYTRDVIAELLQQESTRQHPELPVECVIMPEDVLEAMRDGLDGAPIFSTGERREFESRLHGVAQQVLERQEADVLEAITRSHRPDREAIQEYVECVFAWATDESVTDDRGEPVEPDPLAMKVFEIESLGRFDEDDYEGTRPNDDVRSFRHDRIVTALNRYMWEHRDGSFSADSVDLTAIPALEEILDRSDWDDVYRHYPDFDPRAWEDPPGGTETERLKAETIDALVADFGYSPASAELTTRTVLREVTERWD